MSLLRQLALSFIFRSEGAEPGKVSDSFEERVERFGAESPGAVLKVGVSNEAGVTPLRSAEGVKTSKYKWVRFGDIFYNPMRLNVGSVALFEGDEPAITSPDYVVVKPRDHQCGWLLYSLLKSPQGQTEVKKRTKGSVRERLYFNSLEDIPFPILPTGVHGQAHAAHRACMGILGKLRELHGLGGTTPPGAEELLGELKE